MTFIGAGLAPAGTSIGGFGSLIYPEIGPKTSIFQQADGRPGNAPAIDSLTRDYLVDDNGREIGTDSISAKVQLALFTLKDSSAVAAYGLDLSSLNVFKANSQSLIQTAVKQALSLMTRAGEISIQSVTFQKIGTVALINVNWINLKTSKLQQTQVQAG